MDGSLDKAMLVTVCASTGYYNLISRYLKVKKKSSKKWIFFGENNNIKNIEWLEDPVFNIVHVYFFVICESFAS